MIGDLKVSLRTQAIHRVGYLPPGMDWKLTVINAIPIDRQPARTNIHQLIGVL